MKEAAVRACLLTLSFGLLAGCRLELIVSDGGSIQSLSGLRDCVGPNFCTFDLDEAPLTDRFTVSVNPGYEFVRWQDGSGFLCGNSAAVTCDLSLPGGAQGEAILALYDSAQLMPVFRYVGVDTDGDQIDNRDDHDDDNDLTPDNQDLCPLDPDPTCGIGQAITTADTITRDGKEWAQPDLFLNVSWNQINAVCPQLACPDGAILNGYDMTGWRWARVEEVVSMFNSYSEDFFISSEIQSLSASDDTPWAQELLDEGWRDMWPQRPDEMVVGGHVWGSVYLQEEFSDPIDFDWAIAVLGSFAPDAIVRMSTEGMVAPNLGGPDLGAWFYRPE